MAGGHAWWGVCIARGHAWWGAGGVMYDTHTSLRQILWLGHTVNERAVRISLECILVSSIFLLRF